MTCIATNGIWMAADRRVTSDDGASSSLVKIAKNEHLIAAAAGSAACTLDLKRAVRKGASSPQDLVELVDKDSHALVLLPSGDVHRIEEGRVWPAERGLVGIGSGADLALGWLLCAGRRCRGNIQPADVKRAFQVVAKRRSDCGGGVDIRSFGR